MQTLAGWWLKKRWNLPRQKSQESWEISESESWSSHQNEVTEKFVASRNSVNSEFWSWKQKWPHIFHVAPAPVPPLEKVSSRSSSLSSLFGRIHDLPTINSWSQGNCHSKWLKSWSWIRQKSVVWPRVSTNSLRRDQRLNYVEITNAKTYVFSESVLCLRGISDQPVEARNNKLNGFWKHVISKIWIESMESRWSSSEEYSEDPLHWASSKRFKKSDWSTLWTWAVRRNDHLLYKDMILGERGNRKMSYEFCYSCELCSRILARSLVIFGSWIREEMVRNLFWWTRWRLGTRLLN